MCPVVGRVDVQAYSEGMWSVRVGLVITVSLLLFMWAAQSSAQGFAEEQAARRANDEIARLYDQGQYHEATILAERALAQAERILGPENPETLLTLNNLAVMHRSLGQLDEAEPLYLRALETQERILGPEHPDTLLSLNNLAVLYQAQGRLDEAESLLRRTVASDQSRDRSSLR